MDHYTLRVFLCLSETLHFGKASRACNMSPSALSRTIRRLEEEVGQSLFIRDNRSVELTATGARLGRYAREALDGWESFRHTVAGPSQGLSGEVRIYCSVAASYTVLSGLFRAFRRRHPRVHIRLETGDPADAVERVKDASADITVAARPDALPAAVCFKTIVVTPLVFVAPTDSSPAAQLTRTSPVPWDRVPMILPDSGLSRRRAEAWFRARSLRPNVYAEVSGHEAIVSMVRLGCGVGVVPRIVLERFSQKGEVRCLEVEPALEPYDVGLCAHKRRLASPVVRAFWDTASSPVS